MKDFYKHVQSLIEQNSLEEAIGEVQTVLEEHDSEMTTDVIMLTSEFQGLKQKRIRGIIDPDKAALQERQLIHRLLSFLGEIRQELGPLKIAVVEAPLVPATPIAKIKEDLEDISDRKKTILFLGAVPRGTPAIDLDEEVREISEGLVRSRNRDQFEFIQRHAVRPRDLRRVLLDLDQEIDIIHFAGHGVEDHPQYGTGLLLEDEQGHPMTVNGEVLSRLFGLFSGIRCVLINGCDSVSAAHDIATVVPYVIGMRGRITDSGAIAFATGFYDAIAAGKEIEFAFEMGKSNVELEGLRDAHKPTLVRQ